MGHDAENKKELERTLYNTADCTVWTVGEARGWEESRVGRSMRSKSRTRERRVQHSCSSTSQVAERGEGERSSRHREMTLYASRVPIRESTAGLGRPRSRRASFMADRGETISTPSNPRLSAPTVARNGGWGEGGWEGSKRMRRVDAGPRLGLRNHSQPKASISAVELDWSDGTRPHPPGSEHTQQGTPAAPSQCAGCWAGVEHAPGHASPAHAHHHQRHTAPAPTRIPASPWRAERRAPSTIAVSAVAASVVERWRGLLHFCASHKDAALRCRGRPEASACSYTGLHGEPAIAIQSVSADGRETSCFPSRQALLQAASPLLSPCNRPRPTAMHGFVVVPLECSFAKPSAMDHNTLLNIVIFARA
ncbi:hypothetical protein K458DRAFT_448642 [Lentithecium fluviatile CBS 122367]|uniref:Uncharacterized protein n=1 Tax=Lentithecium fluviatile CBS 122367 TaxID=1168545 RepID=A0A6G1JN94_9PLEO|nr:hypothetical protein K458DRAFT_448642 [Lentithecium fluviatile CBS 122367]